MNVLSLFDGMSCGQIALNRIGIRPTKYYAAEIDKYAIQVTQKNYPDTIQLGSVTEWKDWNIDWASIDLVSGGFPCQAWSVAGKQLGDKDERGMLFWTMLDIMKKVLEHNPKAKFLMENVKMKKEFEEYITYHTEQALGTVYKHLINSSLVSAQNRQRYYWTNIEGIEQPEDKGLVLRDILEDLESDRPCEPKEYNENSLCYHIANATDIKGNESIKRVYAETGKAPTLTTMGGGHREPKVLITVDENGNRIKNTPSIGQAKRIYSQESICPTLNTGWTPQVSIKPKYRKLTPLECERLQTAPDGYTEGVSNTQRYKMLGNGWTVDVIAHIYRKIKE